MSSKPSKKSKGKKKPGGRGKPGGRTFSTRPILQLDKKVPAGRLGTQYVTGRHALARFIKGHHKSTQMDKKVKPVDGPSVHSLHTLDPRSYEPLSEDSVSLSASLVNPLTVYRFRLGGYTTVGRTSGVVNAFIAADPSASGWNSPEWSTLSALFSEFKLVSLGVRIARNYNASVSVGVANLAICSNLGQAANPGSYAAVADNADATFYSYTDTARFLDGRSGVTHVMHATDLNYSQVTTPTVEPYAGAPGCIQIYSDNGLASGTDSNLFQILIWGIYDFRIRV